MRKVIKTQRASIRRETSGVKRTPEECEKRLAESFDAAYNAWLIRRNLRKWDNAPSFRRIPA